MPQEPSEKLILAADVGGTNLNLALLALRHGTFTLLRQWKGSTQGEAGILEPAQQFLAAAAQEGFCEKPAMACISAAGPLRGTRIKLANASWSLDGTALERALGMPVHLMNDFIAVSYGVLLLDLEDEQQVLPLPHGDGSLPVPNPRGTVLIVGAGTGLGVGYVTRGTGRPQAHPSEGGHIALPLLDDESIALWKHLAAQFPGPPDAETAVSGPGLAALFGFLVQTRRVKRTSITDAILALPPRERPAAISRHGDADEACGRALDLLVDLYARACAELCAVFLPTGGLFLAGGIAAKNAKRFLDGQRFMRAFERNCREHIDLITRSTPVFMAMDYSISLYGAAHAGCLAGDPQGSDPRV